MKDRYEMADFKTRTAREVLKNSLLTYEVLETYRDETAQTTLAPYVDALAQARKTEEPVDIPENLSLEDGRQISADEIIAFTDSIHAKQRLDALHFFEEYFQRTPECEKAVENIRKFETAPPDDESRTFADFLRKHPVEATFVRLETVYPEIRANEGVLSMVMGNTAKSLGNPLKLNNGQVYPAIGHDFGPRTPPIDAKATAGLIMLWQTIDRRYGALIRQMALSPDMSSPKDGPGGRH